MNFFKPLVSCLITEECYSTYFEELDFFNGECFKTLIVKALGYGIICGSAMVKVPQIQKIWAAKSGEGLNFLSMLMELFAYTTMLAYSLAMGFPISSYGDSFFVLVQTVVIMSMYLIFSNKSKENMMFIAGFVISFVLLVGGATPVSVLAAMQSINIPIVVVAKSMQIGSNYSNSGTGQLSKVTQALMFLGSLARILTSYKETGDTIIILSYVIGCSLNGIILFQILYYENNKDSSKKQN